MYAVLRLPCLMEDEGRTFFIGARESKEEAEALIKKHLADGYFRRSDFMITKEVIEEK